MPEVNRFFGIVIRRYFDEHNPPHFHAIYAGNEAQVAIERQGMFPRVKQVRHLGEYRLELSFTDGATGEQGRAKPNPQAAALVLFVRKYPDTLQRLEKLAAG